MDSAGLLPWAIQISLSFLARIINPFNKHNLYLTCVYIYLTLKLEHSLLLLSVVIRIAKGHLCALSLGNRLIKMAKYRQINQSGLYIMAHY